VKRWFPVFFAALLVGVISDAGAIHVWSSGQTVRAGDLNSNFTHVHTYMVGGGKQGTPHNLLTDADVDPAANIQLSKVQNLGPGLPKAFGSVTSTCSGAAAADTACTIAANYRLTRISSDGTTGQYRIYLGYLPPNVNYVVSVSSMTFGVNCIPSVVQIGALYASASTAPQIKVSCYSGYLPSSVTATDSAFQLIVLDDDY
jgi:hypothetical protein